MLLRRELVQQKSRSGYSNQQGIMVVFCLGLILLGLLIVGSLFAGQMETEDAIPYLILIFIVVCAAPPILTSLLCVYLFLDYRRGFSNIEAPMATVTLKIPAECESLVRCVLEMRETFCSAVTCSPSGADLEPHELELMRKNRDSTLQLAIETLARRVQAIEKKGLPCASVPAVESKESDVPRLGNGPHRSAS